MSERRTVSRRDFIKRSLVGITAAAVPGLLVACGATAPAASPAAQSAAASEGAAAASEAAAGASQAAVEASTPPAAEAVDVTIITSGWPLTPMPTKEETDADPARAGYAAALQTWLDANPGVTFEQIESDIWDQQAVVTAISGGTAPTYVFGPTIGGSQAGARAAFVQGLMADVTPAIDKFGLKTKLTETATAAWEPLANVDGKYLSYPIDAGLNGIIWYRRDLLNELGVEEPSMEWTWEQFRDMIKALNSAADNRKGLSVPKDFMAAVMGYHGWELVSQYTTPSTSWNWSYDFSDPLWVDLANQYRELYLTDQAILSDSTFANSEEWVQPWVNGTSAMTTQNVLNGFGSSIQEGSPASLAKRLNKAYDEVVAFAPAPRGVNGFFTSGYYVGGVSFSPDATPELLDKAAGAVDYMFLGPGWDMQKAGQWEATKDPQAVFNYPLPIDGKYEYEGVPSSFAEAWGQRTLDDVNKLAAIPLAPDRGLFFPAESNTGPSTESLEDMWSTLTFVADGVDPAAEFAKAQETLNQQAGGFNSSVDEAAFTEAAKQYYTAVSEFWQKNAPEFYESTFKPWYDAKVAPELG